MSNELPLESPAPEKYTPDRFKLRYTDMNTVGCVYIHELVNRNMEDFPCIDEIAVDKARLGSLCHIMPILKENDPLLPVLFDGAKEKKCPDLKIDGVYTEVKRPTNDLTENKISKCIQNCHKQANHVIILLPSPFPIPILRNITKGRFKSHEELEIVEFKVEGKYIIFRRADFQ